MDRRDFIKQVMIWAAGLTAVQPVFRMDSKIHAQEKVQPIVSTGENTDYPKLVASVMDSLGGMKAFVRPGDKVLIKPNIGWDRAPEYAATTHPEIVKSLCSLALSAGASRVMVFDRTCNEDRRCYNNSGILGAVESMKDPKIQISYIDERKFVPVRIDKGKSVTEWEFYKDALDADCYINVPVAKQHGLSKLTLGMKNIMGVIGGMRGKIHHDMGQRLADLNLVVKPALTVIDTTRILLRNGPQGGDTGDVKVLHSLIASKDMIAADAFATTLFGMEPAQIESTVAGYQMGLGEMKLENVKIIKV